jgi:hypothetical protein
MILCTLETRHFTFRAAGENRRDALKVMKEGLRKHADDYRIPREWFEGVYDFDFVRIQPGDVIRDGSTLIEGKRKSEVAVLRAALKKVQRMAESIEFSADSADAIGFTCKAALSLKEAK